MAKQLQLPFDGLPFLGNSSLRGLECPIYHVGQKVHLGFSITSYRKIQMKIFANLIQDIL